MNNPDKQRTLGTIHNMKTYKKQTNRKRWTQELTKAEHFLILIRHQPMCSYCQHVYG